MEEQVAAGFPWGISSVGRAPALQAGGQEFESPYLHHNDIFMKYHTHNNQVMKKSIFDKSKDLKQIDI